MRSLLARAKGTGALDATRVLRLALALRGMPEDLLKNKDIER